MTNSSLPSPEILRKLLRYEPETGKLFWRARGIEMFSDGKYSKERRCSSWNIRHADREAFTSNRGGYLIGAIFNKTLYAHRVIWAMVHGVWPNEIDHINGDPSDNRCQNLRNVTRTENCRNIRLRSDNKTGRHGVYKHPKRNKWTASMTTFGVTKNLGTFDSKSDAIKAREAEEARLGYHKNHGRF